VNALWIGDPVGLTHDQEELAWLEAFRRGEPGGAAPLYDRHGERMKSIARNLLGNGPDAEDAVQDAFLKAFRSAEDFRGTCRLSTWLYRLVVNTCYDLLRRKKRRPVAQPLDDVISMPAAAEDHELRLSLEQSLSQLGERPRTAFLLYAVEGLSHKEIGEVLEISESGSKSLLFEARRKLQRLLLERPGRDVR